MNCIFFTTIRKFCQIYNHQESLPEIPKKAPWDTSPECLALSVSLTTVSVLHQNTFYELVDQSYLLNISLYFHSAITILLTPFSDAISSAWNILYFFSFIIVFPLFLSRLFIRINFKGELTLINLFYTNFIFQTQRNTTVALCLKKLSFLLSSR